ncbi:unnamed protein product [Ectocarpus sp. CCAP 1310/34]|nr:unnamed protein product [Ectocarpus sp. CCAP 1310/34]
MVKSFYWSSSKAQATEASGHQGASQTPRHASNSRKTHSELGTHDSTERMTTCQRYHYRRYPEDPNDRWTAMYLRTYIAQNHT